MPSEKRTWFACQRCANCCKWPGDVVLWEDEADRIARFLGLPVAEFIERFTRLRANRTGLSLTEKENGECIFLDGIDCRINAVKPQQCRDFPNKWNFPGWRDRCEAIEVPLADHAPTA
ncbi:MAG: YkgJ family cysteine cluster protein [Verrucomicrobiales bacterium]|nr:YkgJ family cysteine cluster protein [Verrucomicrobiales bacterium]